MPPMIKTSQLTISTGIPLKSPLQTLMVRKPTPIITPVPFPMNGENTKEKLTTGFKTLMLIYQDWKIPAIIMNI